MNSSEKAPAGSLADKTGTIAQSRDGDASGGYKYRNDRSSNITAFTTNHSCVSRVLGRWGGNKNEKSISMPKSVQQAPHPPAPARQLLFLGLEAAPVRPVISGTVIQLPTFSCVNL